MGEAIPSDEWSILAELERKVLWLASWTIHHASNYFNIRLKYGNTDTVVALAALAQDNRLDVFRLLAKTGPAGSKCAIVSIRRGPAKAVHLLRRIC